LLDSRQLCLGALRANFHHGEPAGIQSRDGGTDEGAFGRHVGKGALALNEVLKLRSVATRECGESVAATTAGPGPEFFGVVNDGFEGAGALIEVVDEYLHVLLGWWIEACGVGCGRVVIGGSGGVQHADAQASAAAWKEGESSAGLGGVHLGDGAAKSLKMGV
jgi:hypothetical protein